MTYSEVMKTLLSVLIAITAVPMCSAQVLTGTKAEGIHGYAEFWFHRGSHTAAHGPFSLPGSFWSTPVTFTEHLPHPTYIKIKQDIQHIINVLPTEPVIGPMFNTETWMPPLNMGVYGNHKSSFFFAADHGEGVDAVGGQAEARVNQNSIGDYQYISVGRHATGGLIDLLRGFHCTLDGEPFHLATMMLDRDGSYRLVAGFFGYSKTRFKALYLKVGPNGGSPGARVVDLPLDRLKEVANGTGGDWEDLFPPGYMYDLYTGNIDLAVEFFAEPDKVGTLVPAACGKAPTSMLMHMGDLFEGDINSLTEADDNKVRLLNDAVTLEAALAVFGKSPYSQPSALTIETEMSVGRNGLACQITVFPQYGNPHFIGFVPPVGTDAMLTFAVPEPYRFVNTVFGFMSMEIRFGPINDEDPSQDGWLHDIDYVGWKVSPPMGF